ncbi:hypothetical protein [Salipaludibacillus sp. CF4.18]|uniref:hypothetical protein n=1 Tax=Salipaludibacillus sp. CF4.18 TaxID=3373081 RepID=UPI003EE42D6F
MKRLLGALSLSTLLVLAACGGENANTDEANENNAAADASEEVENETTNTENEVTEENNSNESNEEAAVEEESNENSATEEANAEEEEEVAEGEWETEVGESVETEGGTFTLHARQDEIDTIETGPIVLNIEQLNSQSGELSPDMADIMETDELDMIQIDLNVENTSDEDITFYSGQATIATSTGEQIEADMFLSDHIDGEMMSGINANGTFFFVLENSNAEDVESVRLTWDAPTDADWETIGEDVDIEVEF